MFVDWWLVVWLWFGCDLLLVLPPIVCWWLIICLVFVFVGCDLVGYGCWVLLADSYCCLLVVCCVCVMLDVRLVCLNNVYCS